MFGLSFKKGLIKLSTFIFAVTSFSSRAVTFDIASDFPREFRHESNSNQRDITLDAFSDKISYGESDSYARISIKNGKDIHSIWYRVVNDLGENEIGVTEADGNEIVIPLKCHGAYTVIIAGFESGDDLSNPLEYTECYFYYEPDDNENWSSIGMATMTDDFVASIFSDLAPLTFNVEVQKNNKREGQIRLVNPYGKAYDNALKAAGVPANAYKCDLSQNHYLYFDISDPSFVYMSEGYTGLKLLNHDVLLIGSFGKYFLDMGRSKDEIRFANYEGRLENNVVTFHQYGLYTMFYPDYEIDSANINEGFRLELPDLADVQQILEPNAESYKYFNLQGVEIREPLKGVPYIKHSANGSQIIIRN